MLIFFSAADALCVHFKIYSGIFNPTISNAFTFPWKLYLFCFKHQPYFQVERKNISLLLNLYLFSKKKVVCWTNIGWKTHYNIPTCLDTFTTNLYSIKTRNLQSSGRVPRSDHRTGWTLWWPLLLWHLYVTVPTNSDNYNNFNTSIIAGHSFKIPGSCTKLLF